MFKWIRRQIFRGDEVSRKLLVGLGNPGAKYEGTRHNIGFDALDRLAQRFGIAVTRRKFNSFYETAVIQGEDVALLKPQSYMNRSGQPVQGARQFFNVPVEDLIVLHDDIDLEVGQLKLKVGGGHGGHNGLRDIIAKSGGEKGFIRVRLGVGRPRHGDVTDHVLGRFGADEQVEIDELIERACDAVELMLSDGVVAAQNAYH